MLFNGTRECSTTTGVTSQLFESAIKLLVTSQCLVLESPRNYAGNFETYDFIVVGGGTAGGVLVNRLSEINDWKVLLLEAGYNPPIESQIPLMETNLYESEYDWKYATESDGINHQAFKIGSVPWPRGKMLGGCSSINAMQYVRGRDADFKSWEEEGNPSWTPEIVNSYFKKSESLQDMKLLQEPSIKKFYGLNGPLVVNTFNSTYSDILENIANSFDYLGFKKVKDINSAKFEGLGLSGIMRVNACNSKRHSVYESYIQPAMDRNNLKIITGAFVTKILLNDYNEANGVEVIINGQNKTFYANKEVIVSGGAINSPQLLMLSGIGPADHLLSNNICCKINLTGVGKNLQDQSYIPVPFYGDQSGSEDLQFEAIRYMYNKSGLLAHNSISGVSSFYSRTKNMSYPEFQTHLSVIFPNSTSHKARFQGYKDDIKNSFFEHNMHKTLYVFAFHLLHPFSIGEIKLRSQSPYDKPVINYNYFKDARDVEATRDGIKMLANIVNSPYFKSINAFVHRVSIPQCNNLEFQSDDYWVCFFRSVGYTVYHPIGTCKMGPNPETAVVDNFLKVYGTKKLRVIDASIMPTLTSGNTNAPTIIIAEMGADMIKAEHLGNS